MKSEIIHPNRTHCPHGHDYTADNTYICTTPFGKVRYKCKTCEARYRGIRRPKASPNRCEFCRQSKTRPRM